MVEDFNGLNGLLLSAKFLTNNKINPVFDYLLPKYIQKIIL